MSRQASIRQHIAAIKEYLLKIKAAIPTNSQLAIEVSRIVDRIRGEEKHNFTDNLKLLFNVAKDKDEDSDNVRKKKGQIRDIIIRMKPFLQDFVHDLNEISKAVTNSKVVSEPGEPYGIKKPKNLKEIGPVLETSFGIIEKEFKKLASSFENSKLDENVNDPSIRLVSSTITSAATKLPPLKQGVTNLNHVLTS